MSLFLTIHPQPILPIGATGGQGANTALTTASQDIPLAGGNAYRFISNVDCYLRMSKQSATTLATPPVATTPATNNDLYLPAKTPMLLIADGWDQVSALGSAAGTLGIVRVQLPL
jgi:hypothetical protein